MARLIALAIIEQLRLRRPVFAEHSTYGHFTTSSWWNSPFPYGYKLKEEVKSSRHAPAYPF